MKTKKHTLIIFYGVLCSILSCTNYKEEEAHVSFAVNVSEVYFDAGFSLRPVIVSSGTKWSVSSLPSWVNLQSIGPSGISSFEWTANFQADANEGYNRDGQIFLKDNTETLVITVMQEGEKGEYIPVESVSLLPTELTLTEGESSSLSFTISPYNASVKEVSWSSSNPSVATVSDAGDVKALASGKTVITVTTEDGGNTASCEVTVKSIPDNAVDLGLSVMWATCNLGAMTQEEYGNYYSWGETNPKTSGCDPLNYKWFTVLQRSVKQSIDRTNLLIAIDKYAREGSDIGEDSQLKCILQFGPSGFFDGKTNLEVVDDAASQKLGDGWRIPTDEEWQELIEQCEWTSIKSKGVDGYRVTSKSKGTIIFLPNAGWICGDNLKDQGSWGDYWSSTLSSRSFCAMSISSGESGVNRHYGWYRYRGLTIRPVFSF